MVALFLYLLALVCWLGGMISFVLFTGMLFSRLPVADAGKVVSAIFPYLLYYRLRQPARLPSYSPFTSPPPDVAALGGSAPRCCWPARSR